MDLILPGTKAEPPNCRPNYSSGRQIWCRVRRSTPRSAPGQGSAETLHGKEIHYYKFSMSSLPALDLVCDAANGSWAGITMLADKLSSSGKSPIFNCSRIPN